MLNRLLCGDVDLLLAAVGRTRGTINRVIREITTIIDASTAAAAAAIVAAVTAARVVAAVVAAAAAAVTDVMTGVIDIEEVTNAAL
jgi:hypothetical protein